MTLQTIVYTLQEQLRLLGQQLVQSDPRAPLEEELAQLDEEERKLQRGLGEWQLDVRNTRQQIDDMQMRAALLLSQVEALVKQEQAAEAYQRALELDQLRSQIPATSKRLPALEQTCWCLQFRIRQLRRRRDQIKDRLRTSAEDRAIG